MKNKNNKCSNILHITPHLGGGVGSVLLNYLTAEKDKSFYNHYVATLDYANDNAQKVSKNIGFELFSDAYKDINKLLKLISKADIVLVHFWNHPLLYDFLVRNELPESRVIFWSHISGFTPPNIFPQKVLNYPDKFIFTTPLSFSTNEVKEFQDKEKFAAIWSTGGVDHAKNIKPKPHKGFNIGYIGTIDYSKMHPDFLEIYSKINIPDVKFIVCGGPNHLQLKEETEKMGISHKFKFLGKVEDITKYLEVFDVFGYPLNPHHFGTCDQVLQEAMAAGVIPVVLNNKMENYMIKNSETGIVARDAKEYISAIEKLYDNPELRQKLSKKTKEYAINEYSITNLQNEWSKIFEEVLQLEKTTKKWDIKSDNLTYFEVFKESLGSHKDLFMLQSDNDIERLKDLGRLPNWNSKTKGTIHQYYEFFNDDEELKEISGIMKDEGSKVG